ncbi:hypothetical protein QTG56_11075 [Rossellomorea sp. AcN35-11]|nr:hypothetical protein [Rossellomorea aquimaris]WJV31412.1 hypothetical protein QTG56_11075 [Rossellomorea sp. AcN35-11]
MSTLVSSFSSLTWGIIGTVTITFFLAFLAYGIYTGKAKGEPLILFIMVIVLGALGTISNFFSHYKIENNLIDWLTFGYGGVFVVTVYAVIIKRYYKNRKI